MLEFLGSTLSDRKVRLFAVACCRRLWNLMSDERSRTAVEVAERFADGLVNHSLFLEARELADRAAIDAKHEEFGAEAMANFSDTPEYRAVCDALAAADAARASVSMAAGTPDGGREMYHHAGGDFSDIRFGRLSQGSWELIPQADAAQLLRCHFGNPFRPVFINADWLMPTVTSLAAAAYEVRSLPSAELDSARLAILADALEEAGCDSADILTHLRGPGPHVRGCWVVDLLVGRS
jgi:hypothetical protein